MGEPLNPFLPISRRASWFFLVSCFWAGGAQACLFRQVSLETTLRISPHLIRHIRQLHLDSDGLSNEAFSGMCNFPFTHLQDCNISTSIPFGHKLSLQGAIDVNIYFDSIQPSVFWPIWQRASSNIRHINIAGGCTHPETIPPNFRAFTPLALETLNIMEYEGSVLSIGEQIDLVRWKGFMPALRTVEALSFSPGLELSSFPHRTVVCIIIVGPDAWPAVLAALTTITLTARIHSIILRSWTEAAPLQQLDVDVLLSNLPVPYPPSILLEMTPLRYSRWTPHLPRSISKDMMHRLSQPHRIDHNPPWLDVRSLV
ncbi:hypothetical protein DFH09DRAFT_1186319 [Mycena vulgaris]|nr:hypothetical protein DFH09DRAFT_1186319 [Mycena vulgaris]